MHGRVVTLRDAQSKLLITALARLRSNIEHLAMLQLSLWHSELASAEPSTLQSIKPGKKIDMNI